VLLDRKKRNHVTLGFKDRLDADSQITIEEWFAAVVLRRRFESLTDTLKLQSSGRPSALLAGSMRYAGPAPTGQTCYSNEQSHGW
jgi:hypothetical protein